MTQEIGPMGEEIVQEENLNSQEDTASQKPDKVQAGFKRPKLLTLIILFSTIVLIIVGLNLLSKRNQEETSQAPTFTKASSSPEASANPTNENIAQRVKTYNAKLDSLDGYQKKLQKPIVDLDISFK